MRLIYELPDTMTEMKDEDGNYVYSYGVTLNYLFNVKCLAKIFNTELPIHLAQKKVSYFNPFIEKKIIPERENAYKFETLILDLVEQMGDCLAYEVERNREFAPIKNKTGVDSIDSARKMLKENGIEI